MVWNLLGLRARLQLLDTLVGNIEKLKSFWLEELLTTVRNTNMLQQRRGALNANKNQIK